MVSPESLSQYLSNELWGHNKITDILVTKVDLRPWRILHLVQLGEIFLFGSRIELEFGKKIVIFVLFIALSRSAEEKKTLTKTN
jgi:hypothetical protein